ncbi:MAG: GNAT family N-acetyltransferase [Solibacillus sp.]
MNFSAMTVSFPLDAETFEEIEQLCAAATEVDHVQYAGVMNLQLATSYEAKGFFVLIYNDVTNELAGAASAIDLMGLNTYEWSLVVAPMYRKIGLADALLNVLYDGLEARGVEGVLALAVESETYGRKFLESRGYMYSFSEATLEVKAEPMTEKKMTMRQVAAHDTEALVEIFVDAFGDQREEALDLIEFNTQSPELVMWVAEMNGQVVGTVTTRKDSDAQWITALAVSSNTQGQGIGTEILQWVKDYAYRGGEQVVLLDVEIDNKQALYVYEHAGFMKNMQIDYFVRVGGIAE